MHVSNRSPISSTWTILLGTFKKSWTITPTNSIHYISQDSNTNTDAMFWHFCNWGPCVKSWIITFYGFQIWWTIKTSYLQNVIWVNTVSKYLIFIYCIYKIVNYANAKATSLSRHTWYHSPFLNTDIKNLYSI